MFIEAELFDALIRGAVLMPLALLWIVVLTRIVGLRSFSKMTAFDFAAIGALFAIQFALAWLRQRSAAFEQAIDNSPRILMRDGVIDERALKDTRVTRSDVIAKLREANALERSAVRYVVLEATGDISVLHGESVDDELTEGLR